MSPALWVASWLTLGTLAGQQDQQKPKVDPQTVRIQKLIKQLGDDTCWLRASRQLRDMGTPAVKPLLAVIWSDNRIKDTPLNKRILQTLGGMGPSAVEAYPRLFEEAGQCEPRIHTDVLRTLADLVPYSEHQGDTGSWRSLVESSVHTLQAMNHEARRGWSRELERFRARLKVDPDAGLDAMIRELKNNQAHRREVAAEVLGRMGPSAKSAVPVLTGALSVLRGTAFNERRRQDDFVREAAKATIRIAPNDPRCAVAYSYRLMHAPTKAERAQAALRIGAFGKEAKSEVRILIASMATNFQPSQRVRCESITALGMIGADAKEAIPDLERLCNSKDKAIAVRARAALKQIRGR